MLNGSKCKVQFIGFDDVDSTDSDGLPDVVHMVRFWIEGRTYLLGWVRKIHGCIHRFAALAIFTRGKQLSLKAGDDLE